MDAKTNSSCEVPLLSADSIAPFVRHDRYGELGLAPQPLLEQLRIIFLAMTLLPFKVVGALACLLSYYAAVKVCSLALPTSVRSDWVAALGRWHCRACLFCLGFVRIAWVKVPRQPAGAGGAAAPKAWGIVSNHQSWLDILVHMSHSFPSFVARDATRHTPIIGTISQAMDCVYVDRSKRPANWGQAGVAAVVKQRMQAAEAGELTHTRPVLLFPEGTTTNGRYLLPFKTGAFLAGVPLQPILLRYAVSSVSPAWEAISAPRHIFLILCNPTHSLTCYELPVYVPNESERQDAQLYASNVRQRMLEFSGLKSSRATYEDKVAFLTRLRHKYGIPVPAAPPVNGALHTKQV